MKLKRLTITNLPGIAEGFTLDGLATGINLVTGPNTIGKSSLVRALKYLLREHRKGDPPLSLAAEFTDGATHWRVERTGSVTQWTRGGQAAARPALPDAEELGRYCMAMEDLIAASGADKALAGELHRALRGGFDLDKARRAIKPRHGGAEHKKLNEARKQLREAEQIANSLREHEDRLPSLNTEIEQTRAAGEQCRKIERAKEFCNVIGEHESLKAALDQFPPIMDKLTGREGEELDAHQERIGELRAEEQNAVFQRDRAKAEIDRLGFSGKNLDDADQALTLIEGRLREIENLRNKLEQLREQKLSQRAKLEAASNELGGSDPPQLDSSTLADAEPLAAKLVQLRSMKNELETKIQIAGLAPDEQEIKQHEKAVDALRIWLKSQSRAQSGRKAQGVLFASFGTGLAAVAAGLLLHPLAGAVLMLASLILIAIALLQLRPTANQAQSAARERFEETGLAAPPDWKEKSVGERLRSLEEAVGDLLAAKSRAEGADRLRIDLDKTAVALEQSESACKQFAEFCGFDPAMPITTYDRFIHLTQNWDRERTALKVTNSKIADYETKLNRTVTTLGELLAPWVKDEVQSDIDSLIAPAEAFKSRLDQAQKQAEELRGAEHEIAQTKKQLATCERDIKQLYERAGLAAGDETALRERLDRLPNWKETQRQFEDRRSRKAQIRKDLEGASDLCELAEAQDTAELGRILDIWESIAQQHDSLVEQREQTRAEIRLAESGGTIADAVAKRSEALASLERRRDEWLDAAATNLLLDQVKEAYTADHEPELLRAAGDLFHQVTAHEFKLKLGEDGAFLALDTKQNVVRNLHELSTGTRMQLLLAVRTAWVDLHKSLPLFLDEALTTSDEERTTELVRSLRTLADSGGVQVVYFSARRNEASLWREALGDDLRVIDLAEARGQAPDAETPIFTLEQRPPVPSPSGTPEEYARALAVPPIDPHREAGEIHLFHLLRDDLDQLYSLMRDHRVASLGQAQSMLENQAAYLGGADETWRARLLTRCHVGHAWLDASRKGRDKKIGRNELETSGAIPEVFLDRAVSLLNSPDVDGKPVRFLAKLRDKALKRFRQNKIEAFETWLRENEYIDDRPELSQDERRARVLSLSDFSNPEDAADINQCIDWLEAGLAPTHSTGNGDHNGSGITL